MNDGDARSFGPYRLVRLLDRTPAVERWLARHERTDTSHLVYRFGIRHDAASRRRLVRAVDALSRVSHPHILGVDHFGFSAGGAGGGRGCLVTPYTGNQEGLVTLPGLLALKGGRLTRGESRALMSQVVGAVAHAHDRGVANGPLDAARVQIDRAGRVMLELYGFNRALLTESPPGAVVMREELRSIATIVHRCIAGVEGDHATVTARGVPGAPPDVEAWLARALDPFGGFASAREAFEALRDVEETPPGRSRVLSELLARLRKKPGAPTAGSPPESPPTAPAAPIPAGRQSEGT